MGWWRGCAYSRRRSPSRAAQLPPPSKSQNSSIQPQMSRLGSKAACSGRTHYKTPLNCSWRSDLDTTENNVCSAAPRRWLSPQGRAVFLLPSHHPQSGVFSAFPGQQRCLSSPLKHSWGDDHGLHGLIPPEPKTPSEVGDTCWMLNFAMGSVEGPSRGGGAGEGTGSTRYTGDIWQGWLVSGTLTLCPVVEECVQDSSGEQ